jgi:hypothetical protein
MPQHAEYDHIDLETRYPWKCLVCAYVPVSLESQEAAARKQRQGEREVYRLARSDPASWAARLNLSYADYAHAGAVVRPCALLGFRP